MGSVRWEALAERNKNDSSCMFSRGHFSHAAEKTHGQLNMTRTGLGTTPNTHAHAIPKELTYTVNEFVPPRVKFLPKAAPLYRALLPFAQTRHFLSAPPVGAHILLGASLRARHRCFFILGLGGMRYEGTGLQHPPFYSAHFVPPTKCTPFSSASHPNPLLQPRMCC